MIAVCRLVINLTVRDDWPLIKWSILEFGRVYNEKAAPTSITHPLNAAHAHLHFFPIQNVNNPKPHHFNLFFFIFFLISFQFQFQVPVIHFGSDPLLFFNYFLQKSYLFSVTLSNIDFFSSTGVRFHCLWRVSAFVNALLHPKKLKLVGNPPCNLIISVWLLWFMILIQIEQ